MGNTIELESDLFKISEIVHCKKIHVQELKGVQKEEWRLKVLFKNGVSVAIPYNDIENRDQDFEVIRREMDRG